MKHKELTHPVCQFTLQFNPLRIPNCEDILLLQSCKQHLQDYEVFSNR